MSSETDAETANVSREVAWRVFAREYNDSDYAFKEGDDERAPNYVATPTGAKINRLFVVGVLTEIERVGDGDLLRARVSDPTGAFVVYAGQYQPDAVSFLADAETPSFVAVVGKARTYEPEDSDDVYTSIRPEGINVVDAETRDRWNVETAHETLKRVGSVRDYLRTGVTPETRPPLHELGDVVDHYATDEPYLNELEREARDVLTEVAGVETTAGVGAGDEEEPTVEGATAEAAGGGQEASDGVDEDRTPVTEEESGTSDTTADATESDETDGTETKTAAGSDDFDDIEQEDVGEWDWDEGQREEVADEFGAGFESGAEIADEDDGGDETEETTVEAQPDEDDPDDEGGTSTEDEPDGTADSAETVVMGIIEDENGEEGAERSTIIEKAAEKGVDEEVAEATLEDLLLEGMCYPTDGDRIKPL
jgi:RPA family protein